MSQNCLVIGASGFIGRYICRDLIASGHHVFGVDVQVNEDFHRHSKYTHYAGAVSPDLLQLILSQHQIVSLVYAAGRASVSASFKAPFTDFHENTVTFFEVMDAVRKYSPGSFVLFLSSAAVYGNPKTLPVDVSSTLQPISPYGFHKVQAELIAGEFRNCFGVHSSILRVFSCYGEGQRKLLLWDLCDRLTGSNELVLKGKGNESRDFIHVSDVSAFVLKLIQSKEQADPVYNVATGIETSILKISELLLAKFGFETPVCFEGVENAGNPDNWRADIGNMGKLGFAPAIDIEEGVERYVHWFLSLA